MWWSFPPQWLPLHLEYLQNRVALVAFQDAEVEHRSSRRAAVSNCCAAANVVVVPAATVAPAPATPGSPLGSRIPSQRLQQSWSAIAAVGVPSIQRGGGANSNGCCSSRRASATANDLDPSRCGERLIPEEQLVAAVNAACPGVRRCRCRDSWSHHP